RGGGVPRRPVDDQQRDRCCPCPVGEPVQPAARPGPGGGVRPVDVGGGAAPFPPGVPGAVRAQVGRRVGGGVRREVRSAVGSDAGRGGHGGAAGRHAVGQHEHGRPERADDGSGVPVLEVPGAPGRHRRRFQEHDLMATLAASDVYGYLRQAGFNHNEAVILTAVAGGESGWNPRAHNPKPPDNSYGLFQINMLGAMGPERRKAFGISKNEDLFDPATNAKAAYMIYKWQGFRAWSVYSSGAYKQYLGKAEQAAKYFEQHGFSEGQGGSGVGYQASSSGPGGGGAMTTTSPTGAGSAPQQVEPINVPTDASWIQVGGKLYVAYRIQGEGGASSVVYWEVDDPSVKPPAGKTPGQVSSSQFKKWQAEWIDGGSVEAFRGFKKGGTFQESLDKMLFEMGIAGTEALKDAEVLQVIALYIARPDMSEREFANRLRGTQYFQSKTDKQREWNDLSKAERDLRTQDAAMDLVGLWFTYVGEDIDITRFDTNRDGTVSLDELKKGNPKLASYAEKVASGQ